MPRIAVGVALALVGGALLGNGLLQGIYAIAQWLKQDSFGGLAPTLRDWSPASALHFF